MKTTTVSETLTLLEQTGPRRDIVVTLSKIAPASGRDIHRYIDTHSPDGHSDKNVYKNLDSLVDDGLVEKRTNGATNEYTLTDAGHDAHIEYGEWVTGV